MSDQSNDSYDYKFHRSSNTPGWIVGGILILVGLILLFQTITGWYLVNWWALFILIPAFASFSRAFQAYRQDARLSQKVRSKFLGGIVLSFIACAFLFNINFGMLWPLILIAGGVALLFNSMLPD